MLRRLDPLRARAELGRLHGSSADVDAVVIAVLDDVRARGDDALREYTRRFDGCELDTPTVPPADVKAALDEVPSELRAALELAAGRIDAYHRAQAAVPPPAGLDRGGVSVTELVRPVDRAGVYVPGGRAAYPSTVLMTAIPARVAGVPEVALCVPPAADGRVPAATLAAAAIAGVDEVFRAGGAQAIAAMAYGTETIRPVDVVVGPGNDYVAAAKRLVAGAGAVGIEAPAGPSELVVVADGSAPARAVAADLAAQAEHGPGGRIVLLSWDAALLARVDRHLGALVAASRVRDAGEIEAALAQGGCAVLVRDADEALDLVNLLAPEHVELVTEDAERLVDGVRNAGAVFVGPDAATALGDYVAGASHVLPTGRAARFASALRVDHFRRHVHVVRVTRAGVDGPVGRAGEVIARAEGLEAHAWSIAVRTTPDPDADRDADPGAGPGES